MTFTFIPITIPANPLHGCAGLQTELSGRLFDMIQTISGEKADTPSGTPGSFMRSVIKEVKRKPLALRNLAFLMLETECGFTQTEIGSAFDVHPATVGRSIEKSKRQLYHSPGVAEIGKRVAGR